MQGDPTASGSSLPRSVGGSQVLRSKNLKRDEAIRKKVELELERRTKKKQFNSSSTTPKKALKSTVSSLRPAPAVIIMETAKIVQAAQLMAAKRTDAVLAVNSNGELTGILTDKDISFRVVAESLDLKSTLVRDVMTRDPIAVYDKGSRNEALSIMISRRFRHLPVISEVTNDNNETGTSVVGLLDITKCVFERLEDLERKVSEDQSIISAMQVLERRGTVDPDRIDTLKIEHECPDINQVLSKGEHKLGDFPCISVKANAQEAASVMKQYHSTAVLVLGTPDGKDRVGGIFTTKDIVLRVIAASLDPNTTSVVRVMTPHPDFVTSSCSILEALKKLHAGHFLHLPVIDNSIPVGLVDVMTLTMTMLTYLVLYCLQQMTKTSGNVLESTSDQGPMWNSFWNSTFSQDADNVSQTSETKVSSVHYRERRERLASPASPETEPSVFSPPVMDDSFTFKLKDMTSESKKMYRFTCRSDSLATLYHHICSKTGYSYQQPEKEGDALTNLDIQAADGSRVRVCYLDEEGDVVALESDQDLHEAVKISLYMHSKRVLIYLGDPPAEEKLQDTNKLYKEDVLSQSVELAEVPVQPKKEDGVLQFLKQAPVAVNIGLSCGIVVVTFYCIMKIAKQ